MGRLIRFVLVFLTTLLIGGFILYQLALPSWTYDLPNDYKVWKKSNQSVVLGYEKDGDFNVQVDEYIAEFQYNDNFIGLKTLVLEGEDANVHFYLVNTSDKEVRGPYFDEASYLAVVGVWSGDVLGNWITTVETPDGAKFR